MSQKANDVTEAELSVLQVLWNRGQSTIREIAVVLDAPNQDRYYATVKKLLERLEAKGFVRRELQGIAYLYHAGVDRDALVGQRLRTLSEKLCDGSLTPLLTQLAQHEQLSRKQQSALMALISELAEDEGKNLKPKGKRK